MKYTGPLWGKIGRRTIPLKMTSTDVDQLQVERNELLESLTGLLAEYEDRKSQWGDEYLWDKHENKEVIESARAAIAKAKEPLL